MSECWNWTGVTYPNGYGRYCVAGQDFYAHRASYELWVGPIPKGMVIDHLCRNRLCVNPTHLEVVTQRENLLRGDTIPAANAQKTHCPQGHEYTPENTYIQKHNGARVCKECNREQCRQRGKRLRRIRHAFAS